VRLARTTTGLRSIGASNARERQSATQIVAPGAKLRVVRSEELPSEGSQVTAAAMPGEERQSELALVSFGQIVAGEPFTTVPIAVA
jgi:hypothetical protein